MIESTFGRKKVEAVDNYIIRSFFICAPYKILFRLSHQGA